MTEFLIIAVIVSGAFLALLGLGKFIRWYLPLAARFRGKSMNTEIYKMPGVKHDAGKPAWDLLPMREVEEIVRVLTYGRDKYSADNWRDVPDGYRRYYAAAMRHIAAWHNRYEEGYDSLDDESGLSHLAHAAANLLFLMWFDHQDGG